MYQSVTVQPTVYIAMKTLYRKTLIKTIHDHYTYNSINDSAVTVCYENSMD